MLEAAGVVKKRYDVYNDENQSPEQLQPPCWTKTSVLNKKQSGFGAKIFVTDGAFMISSSCVNPSLTYMAMTARGRLCSNGNEEKNINFLQSL
jgi:hypothetical protein